MHQMDRVFEMLEHRYARILELRGGAPEPSATFLVCEFRAQLFYTLFTDDADTTLNALHSTRARYSLRIQERRQEGRKPRTADIACVRLCFEGELAVARAHRGCACWGWRLQIKRP